jgi:hypothetical protein
VRRLLGLALLAPALLVLLVGFVRPAIRTVWLSLHTGDWIAGEVPHWAGLANYRTAEAGWPKAFGTAAVLSLVPLLILLGVAPLIAFAAGRAGRPTRRNVRLLLCLPVACYAPVAIGVAWYTEHRSFEPGRIPSDLVPFWLTTVGLVGAVGVTTYLLVRPGLEATERPGRTVAILAAILGMATLAGLLQLFDRPLLDSLIGANLGPSLAIQIYEQAFTGFEFGVAAATSVVLGGVLGVLGLGATVLVIATRLRLRIVAPDRTGGVRPLWTWVALAGATAILAVSAYALWPWFTRAGRSTASLPVPTSTIAINTWLPPLLSTAVGVGLAALAAFGIGAVRPFGAASDWLLLPFAPFLFGGLSTLAVVRFQEAGDAGAGNTFWGLVPPGWLSVPALVILAVFFRGQPPTGPVVRSSLPLVGVVALATWVVQAQDVLWPLLVGSDEDFWTGPVTLLLKPSVVFYDTDSPPVGIALPLRGAAVLAALLMMVQLLYFDRLVLRTGVTTMDSQTRDTANRSTFSGASGPPSPRNDR